MISGLQVIRSVPGRCVPGLADGSLVLNPGAIYRKGGGIFAHFQAANPDAMRQLGNMLGSSGSAAAGLQAATGQLLALSQASVALNGLNLAVTVAGFAIVCAKLNRIDAQLVSISGKLDKLLDGQARMEWRQEMERKAKTEAILENLALGLRTRRQRLTENGVAKLTESAGIYREVSSYLLQDLRQVYADTEPLSESFHYWVCCSLAKAHALALLGHPAESIRMTEDLQVRHAQQLARLQLPLKDQPVWLGKTSAGQRLSCRSLVAGQRLVPTGLQYAESQYRLCADYGVGFDQLAKLTEKEPIAFLLPRKGGRGRSRKPK